MRIKTLFVIDDDKIYHFLFKNLLKQNGINVDVSFFNNGQEAIDTIKKSIETGGVFPDLILLDVNMPIMNGWQFLEEYSTLIPSLPEASPVYMISSSNNEVDLNRAKEFGSIIKDYLLKPVCKEDLDMIFANHH